MRESTGGKVASKVRTRYTRLLPKNTGALSFQYTPIMGIPTDRVKVEFFEGYLKGSTPTNFDRQGRQDYSKSAGVYRNSTRPQRYAQSSL
jgi:hypothetical protein